MALKLEAGKYYRDAEGKKVGPLVARPTAGWFDLGIGSLCHWDETGKEFYGAGYTNLIAPWHDEETGTLLELNPQPGDVVECVEVAKDIYVYQEGVKYTCDECGYVAGMKPSLDFCRGTFRIVSRAAQDEPEEIHVKTRSCLAVQKIGKVEVLNNGKVWMQHTADADEMRAAARALVALADALESN